MDEKQIIQTNDLPLGFVFEHEDGNIYIGIGQAFTLKPNVGKMFADGIA